MKFLKRKSQAPDGIAGLQRGRQPLRRLPRDQQYGQGRTFSYYAARSQTEMNTGRDVPRQDQPPIRRLPSRLRRVRKHAGLFVAAGLLLALAVYEMQLATKPRVVSLSNGSEAQFLQDSAVYQRAAQQMFAESAANRNKLTVDANDIAQRLRQRFPEVREASVSLPVIGDTPTVYIRPATPAMILATGNGSYVVDQDGRAVTKVSAGTNLERLEVPSVTDQSGLAVRPGQQVLPRSAAAFIGTVATQLKTKNMSVQSMTLPAAAGELDVYLSGRPYFIKFNIEKGSVDTALHQTGTFLAVVNKLDRERKLPSQYIDVRLEGRAYYK